MQTVEGKMRERDQVWHYLFCLSCQHWYFTCIIYYYYSEGPFKGCTKAAYLEKTLVFRVFPAFFIKCVYNPATFSAQRPPNPVAHRTMSETHFNVFIPSTGAGIQASSTSTQNVPWALCEVNGPAPAQLIELIVEIIVSTYKHVSQWSETSCGPTLLWYFSWSCAEGFC